jgi:hypothetical protein
VTGRDVALIAGDADAVPAVPPIIASASSPAAAEAPARRVGDVRHLL